MSDDENPPLAGTMMLFLAAVFTITAFWMLRSGSVPLPAWLLIAILWTCGSIVKVTEVDA